MFEFEVKFFGHKRWNIFLKLVFKHLWAFLSSAISDMNLDTDSFIAFKKVNTETNVFENSNYNFRSGCPLGGAPSVTEFLP